MRQSSENCGAISDFTLCLIPGIVLVLSGLLLFGSAGHDDAHITYWPAYTLANFGEMLNYNGERVEQSSSLLQVLLLAALAKITGLGIVTLGKVTAIAFGVVTVALVFKLVTRVANRAAGFSAALLTALSPYFVYWSYGGLESTMVSLLGIALVVTVADYLGNPSRVSLRWPALTMILFELVRPETPLLLGCLLLGVMMAGLLKARVADKGRTRELLARSGLLLVICATTFCAIVAYRWWYFGSLFPQPVTAKAGGFSLASLMSGVNYIDRSIWGNSQTATAMTALAAVIAAGATVLIISQMRAKEPNLHVVLSLLYVAGYLSFVVLSGGDWMGGGRFFVPFLPVAIAFVPLGLVNISKKKLPLVLVTLLLAALEAEAMLAFAQNSSTGIPLGSDGQLDYTYSTSEYSWFETHSQVNMRDVPVIDQLDRLVTQIARRYHRPVILMSGQMGMIAHYVAMRHFGDVRFLDMRSLVDRAFTGCAITQHLPKSQLGLWLQYDFYFAHLPALERDYRLARPDIIFDLGNVTTEPANDDSASRDAGPIAYDIRHIRYLRTNKRQLAENGYTVLYSQVGDSIVTGDGITVNAIRGDEFIAVRTDLLGSLDAGQVAQGP